VPVFVPFPIEIHKATNIFSSFSSQMPRQKNCFSIFYRFSVFFIFSFPFLGPHSKIMSKKKSVCVSVCTHILIEEEESHSHKVDIGSEASKKRSVSNKKEKLLVEVVGGGLLMCVWKEKFLCAAWRKKKEDIKRKKLMEAAFRVLFSLNCKSFYRCDFKEWIFLVFKLRLFRINLKGLLNWMQFWCLLDILFWIEG